MRRFARAAGVVFVLLMMPAAALASPSAASWSVLSTPNPARAKNAVLYDLACAGATDCMAVGSYDAKTRTLTLAEHWDGATWRVVDTPNPDGSQSAILDGVWCASAAACLAVGSENRSNGSAVPLAESWDGSAWSIDSPPAPHGAAGAVLIQDACTGPTACTAVGLSFTHDGEHLRPLVERWDGASWSQQHASMPPGATDAQLLDVSCASPSDCAAVGARGFLPSRTLAEHWDGSAWSVVPSPNPTDPKFPGSELGSVSCSSSSACVAVGVSQRFGHGGVRDRSLIERWDGSTWSLEKVTVPGNSSLWGVWCASANACMAVGSDRGVALAERWNGSNWTLQEPPLPPGATSAMLWGVVCRSATACIAAGSDSAGQGETLAERYSP